VQPIKATTADPAKKTDGDCYLDSFVKCTVLATIFLELIENPPKLQTDPPKNRQPTKFS